MPSSTERHCETTRAPDWDLSAASFAVQAVISTAERREGIDAGRSRLALLHAETALPSLGTPHRVLVLRGWSALQLAEFSNEHLPPTNPNRTSSSREH